MAQLLPDWISAPGDAMGEKYAGWVQRWNGWMAALDSVVKDHETRLLASELTDLAQGNWDGTVVAPSGSNFNINTGSSFTRHATVGKTCVLACHITMGGAATAGVVEINLPVTAATWIRGITGWTNVRALDASTGLVYDGKVAINAAGTKANFGTGSAAGQANAAWTNAVPFSWASGDTLTFMLTYPTV